MENLSYYNDEDFTELLEFNLTEDDYHQGVELPFSHIYLPLFYILIFFAGVSGNVFVIAVMCGKGESRRLVDTFVANLATADLAFVFTLPFWAVSASLRHRWDFGEPLCKLSSYVVAVNRFSNVFFLTCMSVDRYLAVARLLDSRLARSRRGMRLTCAAVWASSLLLGVPSLVFRRVSPRDEGSLCVEDAESAVFSGLSLASLVLAFLLPLLVVLFCYGSVLQAMRRRRLRVVPGDARAESRRRRSLWIVLAIVATFTVSCLPFNVFKGVLVGSRALGLELPFEARVFLSRALVLSSCLAFFNSCANPLVYLLLDRHFRRRARRLCLREPRGGGRRAPTATAASGVASDGLAASSRTRSQLFSLQQTEQVDSRCALSSHQNEVQRHSFNPGVIIDSRPPRAENDGFSTLLLAGSEV